MKVYVIKNDIDISNFKEKNYYDGDDVEITTLSDYTKQVRKEVLQEVKVALREKVIKMQDDTHYYSQNAIHWQDVVAILDQIQGEGNGLSKTND